MSSWKRDFGRGLIVLAPILVTVGIVYVVYSSVANIAPRVLLNGDVLEPVLVGVDAQGRDTIAGLLRVLAVLGISGLLLYATGAIAQTAIGELLETWIDRWANRLPGLRLVYNASKTTTEITLDNTGVLQTPVTVEPWLGLRMTAFKTGQRTEDGRLLLFLPTAPNITTGFVLEARPDDVTELNESVEEALTGIISAGFGDATGPRSDGADDSG